MAFIVRVEQRHGILSGYNTADKVDIVPGVYQQVPQVFSITRLTVRVKGDRVAQRHDLDRLADLHGRREPN